MSLRFLSFRTLVLFGALIATLRAADKIPLRFDQIDLTDGRQLKNVVVKSYDAKAEKLLIVADRIAMTLPIALLPAPYNEKLKAAPAAGTSVSTSLTLPRPAATSAEGSVEAVAQPATPAPEVVAAPEVAPAPSPKPSHPAPRRSIEPAQPREATPTQHQFVARSRANRYYRYEHQVGSNAATITALEFDLAPTTPVPGWSGRCRTEGKAYIEYYDSRGRSYQRTTSTFEILTEQKPGEEIKVVDFTRKS